MTMTKGPYLELTREDAGWALLLYRPDAEPMRIATLVDMAAVKAVGYYLDWYEDLAEADVKGEPMYRPIPPGQEDQYPVDPNPMDFPCLEVRRSSGRWELLLYPDPGAAPQKVADSLSRAAVEALNRFMWVQEGPAI
jgi:hypothetical protein